MNEQVGERRRQRRRAASAWLATVALLLQALLPTGLVAAAGFDRWANATRIYCGTRDGPEAPAKKKGAAPHHCVLCLAAAAGAAPATAPAVPRPRLAEMVVGGITAGDHVPEPSRYAAAQPRGPPVAG